MSLHIRRKRELELAAREAAGESLWTDKFDYPSRVKIVHAFQDVVGDPSGPEYEYYSLARGLILRDAGLLFLLDRKYNDSTDLLNYLLQGPDEMIPTVIESMSTVCNDERVQRLMRRYDTGIFNDKVNTIFREHRISFELVGTEMIEFSSRELHQEVIVPVLRLLAGRSDLSKAESAYRDALHEISKGQPSNAITDAGTALQEALNALGCEGNSLGPLIKSAREAGLLAPHDSPMLNAVDKVMNWVSADRSERGDAHSVSPATINDAWFIVHIVGSIVLRLSKVDRRGNSTTV